MNILLAIDGSAHSDAAVREVCRRPWPPGSTVKVVTAIVGEFDPDPHASTQMLDLYLAEERRKGQGIVHVAADAIRQSSNYLTVESQLLTGSPKKAILDFAEQWPADLIVVGSHGYGRFERFLLGSVSHSIVLHAPCSVEIVRPRREEPTD